MQPLSALWFAASLVSVLAQPPAWTSGTRPWDVPFMKGYGQHFNSIQPEYQIRILKNHPDIAANMKNIAHYLGHNGSPDPEGIRKHEDLFDRYVRGEHNQPNAERLDDDYKTQNPEFSPGHLRSVENDTRQHQRYLYSPLYMSHPGQADLARLRQAISEAQHAQPAQSAQPERPPSKLKKGFFNN